MKNTRTTSLTIHEFSFIQSRIFGRKVSARWPSTRTSRAGRARRKRVKRTKGRACHQGVTVIRQVAADDDRGDQVAGEDAQQQKPQDEAEPDGRRLKLAHPLWRFRTLPSKKHVDRRDEEKPDDHVVDRLRLRAAALDSLEGEVGDRDDCGERDGGTEDVGGGICPPLVAGGEEERADDLRAGDHHEGQGQGGGDVHGGARPCEDAFFVDIAEQYPR